GWTGTRSSISRAARRGSDGHDRTSTRAATWRGRRLGWAPAGGDARDLRAPVCGDGPLLRAARAGADALRPDRLREALLAAARRAGVGALDRLEHLGLADRARARRAVLRPVHARGRLDRSVHGDHRARAHHVGRDQVDGAKRLRTEPGGPPG